MYDMIKLRYHKFKKKPELCFYGLASKWAHNLKLTKKNGFSTKNHSVLTGHTLISVHLYSFYHNSNVS